jgi:hypothetical protein
MDIKCINCFTLVFTTLSFVDDIAFCFIYLTIEDFELGHSVLRTEFVVNAIQSWTIAFGFLILGILTIRQLK